MIRMITIGSWKANLNAISSKAVRVPVAIDRATRDEAMYFQRKVIEAFRTQGEGKWEPLNAITIALRRNASKIGEQGSGGTKALVRSGSLRKSVKVQRRGRFSYFVGVHRTARKGRRSLANIAAIHETGLTVIPITDKMRKYFLALFWKGVIPYPWPSPKKRFIVIPRRSFLGDTFEKTCKGARARFVRRVQAYLSGAGSVKIK